MKEWLSDGGVLICNVAVTANENPSAAFAAPPLKKKGRQKLQYASICNGAAQRHLIGVLEVAPDRQPVGDA